MVLREAKKEEVAGLFREGYKVWSKGRTFEKYCADNGKEDAYGTRYVLEDGGEILSSLILLNLKEIEGLRAYGIGSVLTSAAHQGNGYATKLLKKCLEEIDEEKAAVLLYSEINLSFYERIGFRTLPPALQKVSGAICMARCGEGLWKRLLNCSPDSFPGYF